MDFLHTSFSELRRLYRLFAALFELGFKPSSWCAFIPLYFKKNISAKEFFNYKSLLAEDGFKDSFLSYSEAEYYWSVLNPKSYSAVARDKYLSHLLLEKVGIPMPSLYAYFNPDSDNQYIKILELLRKQEVKVCVVKPAADSAHGSGVFICSLNYQGQSCMLKKSNGEVISLQQLLDDNKHTPLLFEEKVSQTEQIKGINSSSVNTVRFMTALYPNKDVRVIATFMKIGRKGSDVDNAGAGGNVDCAINDKGVCYNTVQFNSFNDVKSIFRHPDTDALIEGLVIDNWDLIVQRVKGFQLKVPFLKIIGWDIAITADGPVVIEMNNWWDTTGQLFLGKGWRDSVVDCYNSWIRYYNES